MKSAILKMILVFLSHIYIVKPSIIDNQEKRNLRDNNQKTNDTINNNYNIFNIPNEDENFSRDNKEKFSFDNIILNLSIIENKIKLFKNKLKMKFNIDKNNNIFSKNTETKLTKNLINDYFLNEYIDLSEDIEFYLYEVDFLHNGNLTNSLNRREIELISRFYNLTKKNSKKSPKNYQNSIIYYNGISILLLSMLTGGIIGVIIIIYISMKSEKSSDDTFYNKN